MIINNQVFWFGVHKVAIQRETSHWSLPGRRRFRRSTTRDSAGILSIAPGSGDLQWHCHVRCFNYVVLLMNCVDWSNSLYNTVVLRLTYTYNIYSKPAIEHQALYIHYLVPWPSVFSAGGRHRLHKAFWPQWRSDAFAAQVGRGAIWEITFSIFFT